MLGRGFSEIDDAFDKVFKHWPYPTPEYYSIRDAGYRSAEKRAKQRRANSAVLSSEVARCVRNSKNCSVAEVKKLLKERHI